MEWVLRKRVQSGIHSLLAENLRLEPCLSDVRNGNDAD